MAKIFAVSGTKTCSFINTANILLVKKATFRCLLFPILFQCTFGSQTTVLNEVEII